MSQEFLGVFFRGDELTIAIGFAIAVIGGFLIGVERESRGKSAGISTYILVIAGSMIFTYLSQWVQTLLIYYNFMRILMRVQAARASCVCLQTFKASIQMESSVVMAPDMRI